jgi:nucleoside-diphosphate-sugar epimerase
MRIFIAGATGVVGRRAVPLLVAAGHEVRAVGRNPEKRHLISNEHKPTVSPLMIPLVYCHIKSFQRASSVEKPVPGGQKRRDGWESHPVEL